MLAMYFSRAISPSGILKHSAVKPLLSLGNSVHTVSCKICLSAGNLVSLSFRSKNSRMKVFEMVRSSSASLVFHLSHSAPRT